MNESQNQIPSFIKDECINKFEKDISIKIFTHLDKVIKQSNSIDDFSDLDEDPNKDCIQYWLISFLYTEGLYKDIFSNEMFILNKNIDWTNYLKSLEEMFIRTHDEIGGGFRPTVLVFDSEEEPDLFSLAESVEEFFCGIEDIVMKSVGYIAAKLEIDNSIIREYYQSDKKYLELISNQKLNK